MLEWIIGLSGTGKTALMLEQIKERALHSKRSILLVPEQFSSSAEWMVYQALGDAAGAYCEVDSFTSLAEQLLREFGGVSVRTLTDAARVVAVRRALESLGDEVKTYRRHRRSTGFCRLAADALKELKIAGATPEALLAITQAPEEEREKMRDLGLLYAAYEQVIAKSAMDPADRLTTAAQKLGENWCAEVAVFVDNFDGFTAPQYELMRRLMHAERCVVSLCCDSLTETQEGMGLFSAVRQTAQRLRRLASGEGVSVAAPVYLTRDFRHEGAPELHAAAQLVALDGEDEESYEGEKGCVFFTPAQGVYDECKQTAARIAVLVREEGYSYRDIAVICREMPAYEAAAAYEFSLAEIPYFTDAPVTMEHTAAASFLLSALSILSSGLSSERILRLLKSDLCGFTPRQTADLEEYAYVWQLKAADWREPFVNHPDGFGAQWDDDSRAALEQLENMRQTILRPLETFLQTSKRAGAQGISRGLYLLLEAFGAPEIVGALAQELEQEGDVLRAHSAVRAWNLVVGLLDQMEELLGDDDITPSEYEELFALLLRSTDIGQVPETQDAVMFTTADRMRLNSPKVCFVLGLNEGAFPKSVGASGLLTHADRELLVQSGVQMPGAYENRTLLEKMFFYRALTAPSERLYLSCLSPESGGVPMTSALEPLVRALTPDADALTAAQKAMTPAAALDLYGICYREDTPQTSALRKALAESKTAHEALEAMDNAAQQSAFAVKDAALMRRLLGRSVRLSPTRVEQYYRCRFAYFLQYVLKIRPRRRAELSPLESGTLIHYVLEQVFKQYGEGFAGLSEQELQEATKALVRRYVEENMPDASRRFAYLIERLERAVLRLLSYLQEEQRQSAFHPIAMEQSIGEPDGIAPLTLKTPDGVEISVVGQIDRVDVMHREGRDYVRVMDYKTGTKKFSLEDVYCGLNTQMLFYLFTLCHGEALGLHNPVAAGVLYLSGDPAPRQTTRAEAAKAPVYEVDGLILNDEVVLRGMDKEASGLFVPCTFGKDGRPRAGQKLATLEKLGKIEQHINALVVEMAEALYRGEIDAMPLKSGGKLPCEYCDYRCVCRHEDGRNEREAGAPKDIFEPTEEEKNETERGRE